MSAPRRRTAERQAPRGVALSQRALQRQASPAVAGGLESPSTPWVAFVMMAIFASFLVVVIVRLHYLQVDRSSDFASLAERQRNRAYPIRASRGSVLDRNDQPLAESVPSWDLYADPGWMRDRGRATVELSRILELPREELRKELLAPTNGRLLTRGLDDARAQAVRELKIDGLVLRRSNLRRYRAGDAAAHVLGFVLDDGLGGAGVERSFNAHLQGADGKEWVSIDAHGRLRLGEGARTEPAVDGAHVQLTLDLVLQQEVEAALAEAVQEHRPETACAIVLDPRNGEVLAMASWPTFSPERFRDAPAEHMRNNALAFVYESGSTMKPLVAGAAVHEGLARWEEQIFCEHGRWSVRIGPNVRTITDHSVKHGGHALLTVVEGIAKSDNILMAKLGLRMGPEMLHDWIRRFGFGQATGIELPGENVGIMLPRQRWSRIGSCMSVPMGHEMAVTPLQMAAAHAAIANAGEWNRPTLLRRIYRVDPDSGRETSEPQPAREPRRVFAAADAARIQEAMNAVMTEGTGKSLKVPGYSTAGKTGTTEKTRPGGGYYKDKHIGSFVGWAPASPTSPGRVLTLVLVDDPKGPAHYGGNTAGPVAARILNFAMAHYRVEPDQPIAAEGVAADVRAGGRR